VNAAAEVIYDLVDPGANLIFGSVIDPSYTGQVCHGITSFLLFFSKKNIVSTLWLKLFYVSKL
jgi:hypothetical protein